MGARNEDLEFQAWLKAELESFLPLFDKKGQLMIRLLGRELGSHRPNVRLQATRLLGELLGIMAQKKGGGQSVVGDSSAPQLGSVAELMERMRNEGDAGRDRASSRKGYEPFGSEEEIG